MASFFGTDADELIAPGAVPASVTVIPGPTGATEPSPEDDFFDTGGGNDTVVGFQGDDIAILGDGDDVFFWAPGDGSDVVEGDAGTDTLAFLGAGAAETIDISAVGSRALFFRDIADIKMDLDNVETVQFFALGGEDKITVRDLSATDVTRVELDLQGAPGAGPDLAADSVTVRGTDGPDSIDVTFDDGTATVTGLSATVVIEGVDAGLDRLTVQTGDGDDLIDASPVPAPAILLTLEGGAGDDTLRGGAGDDRLLGGGGDDLAQGNGGSDSVSGGAGDDTLLDGSGSDTLRGGLGNDTVIASGGDDVLNPLAGADVLVFQAAADGETDLDIVRGYDAAEGDVVRLAGAGVASSVVVGGNLLLTLDNADADQIRFAGITDIGDLIFV